MVHVIRATEPCHTGDGPTPNPQRRQSRPRFHTGSGFGVAPTSTEAATDQPTTGIDMDEDTPQHRTDPADHTPEVVTGDRLFDVERGAGCSRRDRSGRVANDAASVVSVVAVGAAEGNCDSGL